MRIKEVTLINYLAHKDAQVIILFFYSLHLSPETAGVFFGNVVGTKEGWGAGISRFSSELRREVIRVSMVLICLHLRVKRVQSMSGSGRHGKFLKGVLFGSESSG